MTARPLSLEHKSSAVAETTKAHSFTSPASIRRSSQKLDPILSRMRSIVAESGPSDSFRHYILKLVANGKYEAAKKELERYSIQKRTYPQFEVRARRLIDSCVQFIEVVETKRNAPGISQLSFSRQQDFFERAIEQFEALKRLLVKIEQIEVEVRLEDLRSTVLLIRTVSFCACVLTAVFIIREAGSGFLPNAYVVTDHYMGELINSVFDKMRW
jgi:hypothetical protein